MQIREIAPPATGNQNLSPNLATMFEQRNAPPSLTRSRGAHQSSRASPQNNHLELARSLCHRSCGSTPTSVLLQIASSSSSLTRAASKISSLLSLAPTASPTTQPDGRYLA